MATKTKQTNKKPASSKAKSAGPRRIKQPEKKRVKTESKKIDSGYKLFKSSLGLIKRNWKLFVVITLIYALLNVVLVRGLGSGLNLNQIKGSLQNGTTSQNSDVVTGTALFGYLLGSLGSSSSATSGVYQTLLVIIMSLVIIWALRQLLAGNNIKARDAFYNGVYPLIQFILVLMVVTLQLVPMLLGGWIYSTASANSVVVTGLEKFVLFAIFGLLTFLSLYMITSSIFALYIVTLPNMTPMKALRSARKLVKYRRWLVLRKVLYLPLAILVLGVIIMFPVLLLITSIAQWLFFILSLFVLVVVHSYMYSLYRELL